MKKEKRDIFAEIREGFAALADERAEKSLSPTISWT